MPTLLQINTTLNYGSTGRIAENIGLTAKEAGWRSVIAHGPRMKNPSQLETIQTNSLFDEKIHGAIYSLLLDRHGLGSKKATQRFIDVIKSEIKPDIIHLHNIHGYYINYEVLFRYLQSSDTPVVWTLHDCWSFTGHCANFDSINCKKWKSGCNSCPQSKHYPTSLLLSNSQLNYRLKQNLFNSVSDRLTLVPVSYWLENLVKQSFLSSASTKVIHNGIDLDVFSPQNYTDDNNKKIILGVASPWSKEKGLNDFFSLRTLLPTDEYDIVMIGLSHKQIVQLPEGIIGLERTQNQAELAEYYSRAMAFVNPTYQDNYPTTNLEAIACGTPVITYETGGSPESITDKTGIVVKRGDIQKLHKAICSIATWNRLATRQTCREYAVSNFDHTSCFKNYLNLYQSLL